MATKPIVTSTSFADDVAGVLTNNSTPTFSGTITGITAGSGNPSISIWYSIDGGVSYTLLVTLLKDTGNSNFSIPAHVNWSYTVPAPLADNSYTFAVTDGGAVAVTAGNRLGADSFALDATPPEAPTFALDADGHTMNVTGLEAGATWEYSVDGANNWSTGTGATFDLAIGTYAVSAIDIRQTDAAGNSSLFGFNLTEITAVCFLKGTRVQTPDGEVAVEDLQIGDLVSTNSGQAKAIKWIGRRSYVTRFVTSDNRRNVLPVRIAQGALGENVPHRDLFVSPEHAMCLEGALIPARHLVNGRSIAYFESLETIEYYHIELPRHDVLIAEGAATESWLDCGNRNFFQNVVDYLALGLPDEARAKPCLPFIKDGPVLENVRTNLLARSAAAGYETTTDPDVHLIVDGQRANALSSDNKVYRFELAGAPSTLVIGSRSVTPADLDAKAKDTRQLGACIKRLVLRSAGAELQIGFDHPLLSGGFHAAEASHRWTNGTGVIPAQLLACLAGPVQVEIHLASLGTKYANTVRAAALQSGKGEPKARNGGHLRLAA